MFNKFFKGSILFFVFLFCFSVIDSYSADDKYKLVYEESFYVVKPENKELFLKTYREKLFPFWQEMKKRGILAADYRLFSQRIHTLKPHWTFKTLVVFKNYEAIDKWLEIRDEVYTQMFPGESGYKEPRKIIDSITEAHWDEFIREIPLKE